VHLGPRGNELAATTVAKYIEEHPKGVGVQASKGWTLDQEGHEYLTGHSISDVNLFLGVLPKVPARAVPEVGK